MQSVNISVKEPYGGVLQMLYRCCGALFSEQKTDCSKSDCFTRLKLIVGTCNNLTCVLLLFSDINVTSQIAFIVFV